MKAEFFGSRSNFLRYAGRFKLGGNLPTSVLRRLCLSLGPFVLLALLQIVLGADPLVVALAIIGVCLGLGPYVFLDIDLLTLVPIVFFLRYTGVALLTKTLLLQPISSDLLDPLQSYVLVTILIFVVTAISMGIRLISPQRGLLPDIKSPAQLKKIVIIGAALGLAGTIMNVGSASRVSGVASTGAVNQIGAALRPLFLLALIAETLRISAVDGQRRTFSPTLIGLLVVGVAISFAVNGREFSADCVIAIGATLLVTKRLRIIHALAAIGLITLFVVFISPVVLASRQGRTGQSSSQFISSTANIVGQAATSPKYLDELKSQKMEASRHRSVTTQNDYFEGRADLADRLSWVSLVDTIYDAAQSHERLGLNGLPEIANRLEPRILFPDKQVERNTYSDFLAYQLGLERSDNMGAYSFGLPMEGFFSFGYIGLIVYSGLGLGVLLFVSTLISPMRYSRLFSIFLFVTIQHMMVEQTSDGFISFYIRGLPFLTLICLMMVMATRQRGSALKKVGMATPYRMSQTDRHQGARPALTDRGQ